MRTGKSPRTGRTGGSLTYAKTGSMRTKPNMYSATTDSAHARAMTTPDYGASAGLDAFTFVVADGQENLVVANNVIVIA